MTEKPSIPKGTRDFTPVETSRRNYIFNTIRTTFELFGYQPIETPAMENLSTLLGKYGDEGDKLLFRILNSGDFMNKVNPAESATDSLSLAGKISEKGLRYDLTVPFARFVVQHRHEITFPFKRYQIQPVWRADRPQKGRYREFYQCDVDVVGSNSLLNELELVQIIEKVFSLLTLNVEIRLNNRKILAGIAEIIDENERLTDITVAIDKLDKIGLEGVNKELIEKGLSAEKIAKLQPILNLTGSSLEKLTALDGLFTHSEIGKKGIAEITQLLGYITHLDINIPVKLDLTLARGLNYYTGAIIEVKSLDVEIGSICGGGRYDNLTGIFGMPDVSGVGVSFGADRIYDVLLQLEKFPEETTITTKLFFVNLGVDEEKKCLEFVAEARSRNISAELFPESGKLKKQMNYANNKNIPYVVIIGSEELEQGRVTIKNMKTGEQTSSLFTEFVEKISVL